MKKLFLILLFIALLPLVMSAGDRWNLIFSDGTTTINGTDICLDDGTCLKSISGNLTDTNETSFINNLSATNCTGTNKVVGVFSNGTFSCAADQTAAGSVFDQDLNTTSNVTFNNLTITQNFSAVNIFAMFYNWVINTTSQIYLNFNGSVLSFNVSAIRGSDINNDFNWINSSIGDTNASTACAGAEIFLFPSLLS